MEDDNEQDATNDVDEQEKSETESSDNEKPGASNLSAPGGDVIIIK